METQSLMSSLPDWLFEAMKDEYDDAVDAASEAVEEAAHAMRLLIETTPREEEWKGDWTGFQIREGKPLRYGSTPGAVHTGKMVDSVTHNVTKGETRTIAEAGWIEEGSWEEYFQYQEQGFYNVLAGVSVEGLNSLEQASQVADAVLKKRGLA